MFLYPIGHNVRNKVMGVNFIWTVRALIDISSKLYAQLVNCDGSTYVHPGHISLSSVHEAQSPSLLASELSSFSLLLSDSGVARAMVGPTTKGACRRTQHSSRGQGSSRGPQISFFTQNSWQCQGFGGATTRLTLGHIACENDNLDASSTTSLRLSHRALSDVSNPIS